MVKFTLNGHIVDVPDDMDVVFDAVSDYIEYRGYEIRTMDVDGLGVYNGQFFVGDQYNRFTIVNDLEIAREYIDDLSIDHDPISKEGRLTNDQQRL